MSTHRNFVYYVVLAFGAGIVARFLFSGGVLFVVLLSGLSLTTFLVFLLLKSRVYLYGALMILACASGFLRMDLSLEQKPDPQFLQNVNKEVTFEGAVSKEPDIRDQSQMVVVTARLLGEKDVKEKVLVTTALHDEISYGDYVRMSGKVLLPEDFETDSGNTFRYVSYLAKDDIHFRMFRPLITVIDSGQGSSLLQGLMYLKNAFLGKLSKLIPEPQSSLLGGLLVGAKQSLGEELLSSFRTTGLIHIVVLSGYNMSVVAEALTRVLSFLPLLWGTLTGGVAIVLFVLMTGASATAVRAGIMALLVLLARTTGRVYDITRALFIAGFLMLVHNPQILVSDPSFQLSFLATLGLIQFSPAIERWLSYIPERFALRTLLAATISTQLAVLPLLLYQTGSVSLVGLVSNLLVLPTVPVTMFFGFITGTLAFVSNVVAIPFALVSNALLSYTLFIAETFAQIPFASVSWSGFPGWAALLIYVALFILWFCLCANTKNIEHISRYVTEDNRL